MNNPALKGEVSIVRKMGKRNLFRKMPSMMAVVDVGLDNIRGNVPYRTEKLARTPEVSFSKMLAQPRMLAKKFVRTAAFKQLKSFTNSHSRRYSYKHVDMIRFNLKFKDFHAFVMSYFTQKLVAMVPDYLKFKWVLRVFRFPYKMVSILSNAVSMVVKSFHFMIPPRFFYGANAKSFFDDECASYATHSSSYFMFRNSLWRLGTRAKARGILCM